MNLSGMFRRKIGVVTVVASLALAGCNIIPAPTSDPTRYFLLATPATGDLGAIPAVGALRIGLHTVEVVPYLRRNSLVVRTGQNEVTFPVDARWAEPVDQEIGAALRMTIATSPTVGRVFLQPFAFEGARDFDISVQVQHCEGEISPNGKAIARFSAFWEITSGTPGARLLARKLFVAPDVSWDGKNFAELASLLSNDVTLLGQDLVAALPASH